MWERTSQKVENGEQAEGEGVVAEGGTHTACGKMVGMLSKKKRM